MKNRIFRSLICLALSCIMVFSAASALAEPIRVAVVQPMTHTSLDQIRDTIIAALEASDIEFEIVTKNAERDTAALSTILENVKMDGVDILVPIATNTAQSAKVIFEDGLIPVVFAAVSDPVAAGLTGDDSFFITGVSNSIPAGEIVKLISDFQPDYKKIGFLYTSSETNSVSTINAAKAYCDENGIAYEEVSISNLSELQTAVETLISKGIDALYTGNDNSIASAMSTYIDVAGGFATIGVDYVQLGNQVADIVIRLAKGEKPEDIPYETLSDYARFVNLQAAGTLGMEITEDILSAYRVLVEADGASHFGE